MEKNVIWYPIGYATKEKCIGTRRNVLVLASLCFLGLITVSDTVNRRASALNRRPDYQLLVKSLQGDTIAVANLLRAGVDPNTPPGPNDRGMTALMFAAWKGHHSIVALLAEAGANINARSNSGQTPLMYAAFKGHALSVQILLNRGANPTLQTPRGDNALIYAIKGGQTEIARTLISASNITQRAGGDTPLQTAVKLGNLRIVEALLQANPSVEAIDNHGQTPLMNAAGRGHTLIALRLLHKGANVNARDPRGKTALFKAAIRNHHAVIQVLRARGATM